MSKSKPKYIRLSFMIDEDIHQKLKNIQAFIIKSTNQSYSFSRTINEILDLGLEDRKLSDVIKILIEERNLK